MYWNLIVCLVSQVVFRQSQLSCNCLRGGHVGICILTRTYPPALTCSCQHLYLHSRTQTSGCIKGPLLSLPVVFVVFVRNKNHGEPNIHNMAINNLKNKKKRYHYHSTGQWWRYFGPERVHREDGSDSIRQEEIPTCWWRKVTWPDVIGRKSTASLFIESQQKERLAKRGLQWDQTCRNIKTRDVLCPKITQGWGNTASNSVCGQFSSPSDGKISRHRAQTSSWSLLSPHG